MKTAYFENRKVIVLRKRNIVGGTVVDIVRHPEEQDWPWSIMLFTTSMEKLEFDSIRGKNLQEGGKYLRKTC